MLRRETHPIVLGGRPKRSGLNGWARLVVAQGEGYDAYRKQIEHEDELIGMRNGWAIGAEAFLFAAYAAVLQVPTAGTYSKAARQLYNELPWLGIILAILALVAVSAAVWHLRRLRKGFQDRYRQPEGYPPIMSTGPLRLGHAIAVTVPVALVGAWVAVLQLR